MPISKDTVFKIKNRISGEIKHKKSDEIIIGVDQIEGPAGWNDILFIRYSKKEVISKILQDCKGLSIVDIDTLILNSLFNTIKAEDIKDYKEVYLAVLVSSLGSCISDNMVDIYTNSGYFRSGRSSFFIKNEKF